MTYAAFSYISNHEVASCMPIKNIKRAEVWHTKTMRGVDVNIRGRGYEITYYR